jgi:hypothetical protein
MSRLNVINNIGDEFILIKENIRTLEVNSRMVWGISWGMAAKIVEVTTNNGSYIKILGLSDADVQTIADWYYGGNDV